MKFRVAKIILILQRNYITPHSSLNIEEDNKENFTKYKQHGNASLYLDLNGEFSL